MNSDFLNQVRGTVDVYFPKLLPEKMKAKREILINKTYGKTFDLQYDVLVVLKKIEISHLLAMNEVVVPYLIDEYGELLYRLKEIREPIKKMRQFQELKNQVEEFLKSLKELCDLVIPQMIGDLQCLHVKYSIEIDSKKASKTAASWKPDS